MGRFFCFIPLGLIVLALDCSRPARADDTDKKVRDVNEIINTFREPRTRGIMRGAKKDMPPECEEAFDTFDGRSRSPSQRERDAVESCTKTSIRLDFLIPFALNSAQIEPSAALQLEQIGHAMESEALKSVSFVIAGHTDRRGDRDYNIRLSQQRADAVRSYLLENFAVGGRRLRAVGFGYELPKIPENPYADINRRVELIRTN
jgi:outer membrane protein OmpA-like peptidoglycan-associated protein